VAFATSLSVALRSNSVAYCGPTIPEPDVRGGAIAPPPHA